MTTAVRPRPRVVRDDAVKVPPHKWVIAGTVLAATIMAVLDSSIVNVALPDMSGNLGATLEEITWVVTSYILAQVIVMPITGLLSARFGRKNFYMASVVLFTLASMACGFAHTLGEMIAYRIVQGFGGGVLLTVSQAILRESFPAEEQGMAMGLYGLGAVLAPAFGPTLGGWITDQYSWPWIFYINVPVGIVTLILLSRYIEDPPYLVRERGYIDWPGLGLLVVGLGSLQLLLEEGERYDWFQSGYVIRLAVVATLGLLLFLWRELTAEKPAVHLRILRNLSFSSATALGGVLGLALNGSLFLLPVFLQRLLGYNAMQSGFTLMPRSLAMAVLMPIGGRFYNRLGPRVLVGSGLVVAAVGFYGMARLTTQVGLLGSLLAAALAGGRIQSGVRRAEHRGAVDDLTRAHDGSGRTLQRRAPGDGERRHCDRGDDTEHERRALPRAALRGRRRIAHGIGVGQRLDERDGEQGRRPLHGDAAGDAHHGQPDRPSGVGARL